MHLILTLLPNLVQTARTNNEARIVLQSSDLHRMSPSSVKFASLDEINTDIGPAYLYNRSKLAQILFVRALVRRLESGTLGDETGSSIYANAVHPGAVSTEQQKQAEEAYGVAATVAVAAARPFMKDPITEGPLPALFAATSPDVVKENITGQYVQLIPRTHIFVQILISRVDRAAGPGNCPLEPGSRRRNGREAVAFE